MKIRLALALTICFISRNGFSQDTLRKNEISVPVVKDTSAPLAKNIVFFELFGNGGIYSLNYERVFPLKHNFAITTRIGVSSLSQNHNAHRGSIKEFGHRTVPVSVSALYGKRNKLELGVGYTPDFVINWNNLYDFNNYLVGMLGYRYQKPSKGFFFKCGALYAKNVDMYMYQSIPSTYISFGYTFK